MENHIRLSKVRKDSIATALHQTIESFSDRISTNTHRLCFYYASLGAEVCTYICQQINRDETLSYQCLGGRFSVRISQNPNDNSKGINFGADNPNFDNGNFHLWIVGLVKDGRILSPSEFVDFTSKHYAVNALEQGYEWERDDISDYLWLFEDQVEPYGITAIYDSGVTERARDTWGSIKFRDDMLVKAVENYLDIINQFG